MTTIQIFGIGDAKMHELRNNLSLALAQFPLQGKIEEISEYNRIYASGISQPPALMLDGEIVCEGNVPTVEEIKGLLRNRNLLRSKLYRLRRIMVPVDLSPASENALLFACRMAHLFDANLEVVYVMDSIFEGATPSPSGFLSSYRKTMQDEVDAFVRKATKESSIRCPADAANPGDENAEPGKSTPWLRTNIAFGFPEEVLNELSGKADLLVMGTTGRGNLTRKLFGSVSIAVSKNAHCPVLLVPAQSQNTGFHNILYASNFESLDPLTIKQTVAFARRFNGQLHFVHVGQPTEKGVDLEKKLFEINYVYADPEMPFVFSKVVGENVVESLHEYAFEHRIDLFVFVTHARSFWDELLHHSISKDMLLHTNTPVLVIHAETDTGH
ncbi:MAG: universal stress protein [Saprospirales bacterium]|jgi:nucleotide-binding universal stress UspA family protein|nr:universal stress protein [Saprospirales bacterium]